MPSKRSLFQTVLGGWAICVALWGCAAREAAAPATVDLSPSLITMHLHDVPAGQAFAELFRQANWKMELDPTGLFAADDLGKMTVDVDREPFWKVFPIMEAQSGIVLEVHGYGPLGAEVNLEEYRLKRGEMLPTGPSYLTGPFLIVATQDGSPNLGRREIHLKLDIFCEPRLVMLNHSPQVRVLEAVDERGNSLIPNPPIVDKFPMLGTTRSEAVLMSDSEPSQRLVRFRGEMDVVVETAATKMEIDDVTHARPRSLVVGGTTFTFEGCSADGDTCHVSLKTGNDNRPDKSPVGADEYCIVRMFDAAGRELHPVFQPRMKEIDRDSAKADLYFSDRYTDPPAGAAYRMVWTLGTMPTHVVVPIQLKDVPLNLKWR